MNAALSVSSSPGRVPTREKALQKKSRCAMFMASCGSAAICSRRGGEGKTCDFSTSRRQTEENVREADGRRVGAAEVCWGWIQWVVRLPVGSRLCVCVCGAFTGSGIKPKYLQYFC